MKRYDAVVIGAGPAGSTTALVLARAGWSVGLVEKAAFPRRKVCGEYVSGPGWATLEALGASGALAPHAGPAVTEVGLFADDAAVRAPMPLLSTGVGGRAIGRHILDSTLLEHARSAGADVWQPLSASKARADGDGFTIELHRPGSAAREIVTASLVVAAHGSWEGGTLPTQRPRGGRAREGLLGFKARFRGARLAQGLMPLVLFPGGYGGLVHSDASSVSFSLCIRQDALKRCRAGHPGKSAGEAVLAHVCETVRPVRHALEGAHVEAAWLAAGPIQPGLRACVRDGIFCVGNLAGEAHPLIAEGIGMALQSGALLGHLLARDDARTASPAARAAIGREYASLWRRSFATRVRAAALFAWATTARRATASVLESAPALLTWGAQWSGKARLAAPQSWT